MKFILALFIMLSALASHAQINQVGPNKFQFKNRIYSAERLGLILINDHRAHFNYQEWRKSLRGQGLLGCGGAMLMLGYLVKPDPDEFIVTAIMAETTSILFIGAGAIVATIGVAKIAKGRNIGLLYNAIDFYNDSQSTGSITPSNNIHIDLGYSNGNLGLFVTF